MGISGDISLGHAAVMIAPTSGATTTGITGGATSALIDTATVVLIDITAMRAAMLAIAMLAIALLLAQIVVIMSVIRPKPSPRIPGTFSSCPALCFGAW